MIHEELEALLTKTHPDVEFVALVPIYRGFFIWAKHIGWQAYGEVRGLGWYGIGTGTPISGKGVSPASAINEMLKNPSLRK